MIIDDESAFKLGEELSELCNLYLGDSERERAWLISLGKIAFKLVAPKVLEMIRTPTPAMLDAACKAPRKMVQIDNLVDREKLEFTTAWQAMIDKMREDYGG